MDHHVVAGHESRQERRVADVTPHLPETGRAGGFRRQEVAEGEEIEHGDVVAGAEQPGHQHRADVAGAARHEDAKAHPSGRRRTFTSRTSTASVKRADTTL